jgi:hypothetical protein
MNIKHNSKADGFSKDIEIRSADSTDRSAHDEPGTEARPSLMAEKGDAEACRVVTNQLRDVEYNSNGPATRTRTKSSWKDPGPPPDGGWTAWSQGACSSLRLSI